MSSPAKTAASHGHFSSNSLTDQLFRTLDAVSELPETDAKRKKAIKHCIWFNLGCVCVSLATVVMEVFTLMALQFCDGEDLMSLYWSTFTMIQVGSLIAVCGVILALVHQLRQRKNPCVASLPYLQASSFFANVSL